MGDTAQDIKETAHRLIDELPEAANWKDIIYELSVMQDIAEGLADSDAGYVADNTTVRKEFGLPE